MPKHIKLITNSLLLVILIGVLALPAVSSGMMRITKDTMVLSSQSVRPSTKSKIKTNTKVVIPEKQINQNEGEQNIPSTRSLNRESSQTPIPNIPANTPIEMDPPIFGL